jgi:threonine/homoserine/homoserine lactone efflux protein
MHDGINLPLILVAGLIAGGSPGPSTLAIAGTSMAQGRRFGLALAAGVTTGSMIWSCAAAFGLATVMMANAWIFEGLRYAGAGYLLYLAWKSARSAARRHAIAASSVAYASGRQAYLKGLALHLTNPKAILFFGSLYAIGIPAHQPPGALVVVVLALGLQSLVVFHGYALIFSSAPMARGYMRLRRGFETVLAFAFGVAGLKVLFSRLP